MNILLIFWYAMALGFYYNVLKLWPLSLHYYMYLSYEYYGPSLLSLHEWV